MTDQIVQCQSFYRAQQEPEFALILDNVLFRVTQIRDVADEDALILRRSYAQIRPLAAPGLAPHVMQAFGFRHAQIDSDRQDP